MNQGRRSVIVKHVTKDQHNHDLREFHKSDSESDDSFEDLITNDVECEVVPSGDDSDHQNDAHDARELKKLKRRRLKETKVDRDFEFETKQWFYEAAKQDVLEKKFTSVRACAKYYGLNHGSLNKYIKNDSSYERRGSATRVSQ